MSPDILIHSYLSFFLAPLPNCSIMTSVCVWRRFFMKQVIDIIQENGWIDSLKKVASSFSSYGDGPRVHTGKYNIMFTNPNGDRYIKANIKPHESPLTMHQQDALVLNSLDEAREWINKNADPKAREKLSPRPIMGYAKYNPYLPKRSSPSGKSNATGSWKISIHAPIQDKSLFNNPKMARFIIPTKNHRGEVVGTKYSPYLQTLRDTLSSKKFNTMEDAEKWIDQNLPSYFPKEILSITSN